MRIIDRRYPNLAAVDDTLRSGSYRHANGGTFTVSFSADEAKGIVRFAKSVCERIPGLKVAFNIMFGTLYFYYEQQGATFGCWQEKIVDTRDHTVKVPTAGDADRIVGLLWQAENTTAEQKQAAMDRDAKNAERLMAEAGERMGEDFRTRGIKELRERIAIVTGAKVSLIVPGWRNN